MVSEVFNLYKSISTYDKLVVTNLKKINAELSQAVTEGCNFPLNLEESRSYQLSTAMLGVLDTYNQIVFLTETTLKNLRLKLMQMHRDSPPVKGPSESTQHPADGSGRYTETSIFPKKLLQEAESLEEVKNKAPKALKIQYTPTELLKLNPRGQRTGPLTLKDKCKWKVVPTSSLPKVYKEKPEVKDSFSRKMETLWEEKEEKVSNQVTKSIAAEDGVINEETSTEMQGLSNGDTISILVTGYYKTACHFYAQIFGKSSDQFSELMGQMNSSCMVETYTPFKVYPEIGQLLLTKHDKLWYRARCLSKTHGSIRVFLVDVGITVMKTMEDIAQMADDFLHYPYYALECILDGVCERSELLPERSRKVFEKVMLQKRFTALVVESGIPMKLRIYDAKGLDMRYVLDMYGIV